MSPFLSRKLRRLAAELLEAEEKRATLEKLGETYGLSVDGNAPPECLEALTKGLKRLPPGLVKDCEIQSLNFDDLGPSREFYPNHGVYQSDGTLTLNTQLLDDPMLDTNDTGSFLNRFDHTLFHELGHGLDVVLGRRRCKDKKEKDLSLQPEWLGLSRWSKEPKPGLKQVIIREPGTPELKGEYYYSPASGFARFYGKRNPWDDWADSFAYYVAGLKSFLPDTKIRYFDKLLRPYLKGEKDVT